MIWVLVYYVSQFGGINTGVYYNTSLPSQQQRVEISMPDRLTCEQVAKLNYGAECWAHNEPEVTPKLPTTSGFYCTDLKGGARPCPTTPERKH